MKFRLYLPFVISLLLSGGIFCQSTTSLLSYDSFFLKQSDIYQRWLDASGLGHTLRVQQVEVRNDSLLILYLGFQSDDADTVYAQWNKLKEDFLHLGVGGTLEQKLFRQMVYFMEIQPEQGQIRLFNTYDLEKPACFKAKIYYWNDTTRVIEAGCRNEIRSISINAFDLGVISNRSSVFDFRKQYGKKTLFDKLIPFLRDRFTRQQCDNRYPTFVLYGGSETLHFTVYDLCKEILWNETNPWWCTVLYGMGCESCKTCIKRERLDIHIQYEETTEGFRLITEINAAYGSGWYDKPRDNGYHDLQIDYPAELKRYADVLSQEIYQFLTSKP